MELLNEKYLRINNVLQNLSNYNTKNIEIKNKINNFIENILYYKLFIDNYLEIKKLSEKYSNIIFLVLESDIDNSEKITFLKKILNKIIKKEQTGGLTLNDFKEQIFDKADDTIKELEINKINQDFLKEKIESLNERLQKIINNNQLYELREKIQVIVNELEKKTGEKTKLVQTDYESLYNELAKKIDQMKQIGNNNQEINEYISQLEKYATHIENLLLSSNETIGKTSSTLAPKLKTKLKGGNMLNLKEIEENKNKIAIDKIKTYKNDFTNNFEDIFQVLTKDSSRQLYGQSITIIQLLNNLSELIGEYNLLIIELKKTGLLSNMIENWDAHFASKNTTFYQDLKKNKIYFYETVSSAIENSDHIIETIMNINLTTDITENYNIINKLDNTLIYFYLINHILKLMKEAVIAFQSGNINKESIQKIHSEFDNPIKSFILTQYTDFEDLYGGSRSYTRQAPAPPPKRPSGPSGPSGPSESLKTQPQRESVKISNIETEDIDILKLFYLQFIKSILENENLLDSNLLEDINKGQIDKTTTLTEIMKDLILKISNKLGEKIKDIKVSDTESEIKTFEDLYNKLISEQNGGAGNQIISRPRLDPFKTALKECLGKLTPYLRNIEQFKILLTQNSSGKLKQNETKYLLKLYNVLNQQIKQGINSYIQVIPMIFFTIEFPPSIYRTNKCKYGLTYNPTSEQYTYKLITPSSECNEDELFGNTEISAPTHATFFEADQKNGTKKLIEDPIIGLKKLINSGSSELGPENKVINMMFALGASGTGKTTRYFGNKRATNPDDHIGIVTSIIEEARSNNNIADVELAYFVSYGRYKSGILNEFLLFFKIDKPEDSDGIMPYFMSQEVSSNTKTYTDFYTKLVNKKLKSIQYSLIKDYVENGGQLNNLTGSDDKTFRQILESEESNYIWKKIEENDALDVIFEQLLTRQKEAHTVLPTKNNIESSRGHTCVLIKITDVYGKTKYFPLFDMAGTENTTKMKDFLITNRKPSKMEHIVSLLSKYSQKQKLENQYDEGEGENKKTVKLPINSLEDVLAIEFFKNYVTLSSSQGGGSFNINVIQEKDLNADLGKNELLQKMVNEGFYINHTIGMLIFAAMAVGQSMNSTVDATTDKFDSIQSDIFKELEKFTCLKSADVEGKTKILIDSLSFDNVLSVSCIWTQILFSFLYWNEETETSSTQILVKTLKEKKMDSNNTNYALEIIKSSLNPKINNFNLDLLLEISKSGFDLEKIKTDLDNGKYILKLSDQKFKKISSDTTMRDTINSQLHQINLQITELGKTIENSLTPANKQKLELYNKKLKELRDYTTTNLTDLQTAINGLQVRDNITVKLDKYTKVGDIILCIQQGNQNAKFTEVYNNNNTNITIVDDNELKNIKKQKSKYHFRYNLDGKLQSENEINKTITEITNQSQKEQKELDKLIEEKKQLEIQLSSYETDYNLVPIDNLNISEIYLKENDLYAKTSNYSAVRQDINLSSVLTDARYLAELKLKSESLPDSIVEQNQILRIKDARISATKMVLMHLVTGQSIKHNMVLETINLTNSLWDATQIKLTE